MNDVQCISNKTLSYSECSFSHPTIKFAEYLAACGESRACPSFGKTYNLKGVYAHAKIYFVSTPRAFSQ